ncbi:MAG TPA: carboxypeptidase regulatory-like domain-containing protein [Oleiagrimonas sp.]|nr:carboxypeptidase regulatory-like domain-containing protein [Oleiagrimonas sp.]
MTNRIRRGMLPFAIASLLAAPPVVMAQNVTSSGVTGVVVNADGQPVSGATVTIVHEPSGTTKIVTTSADGSYNARGLRVGGPYDITVSKAGLNQAEREGFFLQLGKSSAINLIMKPSEVNAQQLSAVTVSANALARTFSPTNKGLSTNISHRELVSTPKGNRSIDDIVRLDPRIMVTDQGDGSFSMAGMPNRYNTISVDGVSIGDPFGLNANGLPYQNSPISVDTIAEYNISTANFDVASDTVGAAVNAVTKSGTNEFHGSLYYAYRNADDMVGNAGWLDSSDPDYNYNGYDKDWTGGFTLGGPIVKDKLFFFVAVERQRTSGIGADSVNGLDYSLGDGPSKGGKLSPGDVQKIINIAKGYGLHPGTFGGSSAVTLKDDRYLAKIDWNISSNHRASLSYNRTKETLPELRGNSYNSIGLSSYSDVKQVTTDNYSLTFYDDWSMNFSTQTKLAYQHYVQNTQIPFQQPQINVHIDGPDSPVVNLGTEQYRHYNKVDTKKSTFFFAGTYYAGDHTFKGGVYYERNKIYNLFGRTEFGHYQFDSIAAFKNKNYYQYDLYQPAPGYTLDDVAAKWTYSQISPFVQDTWQATRNLSIQFGLRLNIPKADHKPLYNAKFEQAFGYPNNNALGWDNRSLEPRVSFNYNFDTDQLMQLRGGFGLFQTVPPTVWMTNPYQNNGITVATYRSRDPSAPPFDVSDPVNNPPIPAKSNTIMDVDTIGPNFQLPSVWKFSLALDRQLPWMGLIASAQYLHIKAHNAILYQALNLGTPSGTLPDGRKTFYVDPYSGHYLIDRATGQRIPDLSTPESYDYLTNTPNHGHNPNFATNSTLLSNTDGGKSDSLTLSLRKPFAQGWAASLSGTLTHATEVNPGNSSQASSGYKYVVRINPNTNNATIATRNIARSIKASISWKHAFFGNYFTSVSAFYVGHDGLPYSWIFSGDANGDGISYEDPVYIPKVNDSLVTYGSASAKVIQQFQDFISSDDYLSSHRGQIAHRNEAHSPWSNRVDLSIQQEIPGFFEGNKGIIRLDIYNFLNLVNSDWGHVRNVGSFDTRTLAGYTGINDKGQYIYYLPTDDAGNYQPQELSVYDAGFNPTRTVSRWSILLTLRYTF